uniref:Uncharacterized protein n=1 Tax=Meloidogyne enterolobii TaxID=390850 RepID=A0A6V7WEV2_MELEN|nr:unnamed protein product [Meloidogyne enterolobii]
MYYKLDRYLFYFLRSLANFPDVFIIFSGTFVRFFFVENIFILNFYFSHAYS